MAAVYIPPRSALFVAIDRDRACRTGHRRPSLSHLSTLSTQHRQLQLWRPSVREQRQRTVRQGRTRPCYDGRQRRKGHGVGLSENTKGITTPRTRNVGTISPPFVSLATRFGSLATADSQAADSNIAKYIEKDAYIYFLGWLCPSPRQMEL